MFSILKTNVIVTCEEWECNEVLVPEFRSKIVLVKPGGTSGLDAGVCEGREDLSESIFDDDIGSSNSLLLFGSPLSSPEPANNSKISKPSLRLSGLIFFSWNAFCCSFLHDAKEARRESHHALALIY